VQHFQVLALVFVDALHQDVEHGLGIDDDAGALQGEGANSSLLYCLIPRQRMRNSDCPPRLQPPQLRQILDPVRADVARK